MDFNSKEVPQHHRDQLRIFKLFFQHLTQVGYPHTKWRIPRRSTQALMSLVLLSVLLPVGCGASFSLYNDLFVVPAQVVHLQVTNSPVPPNQPVNIEYYTDMGIDGTIWIDITKPPLLAIFWQSGPMPITGGLLNSITASGFNDPGTYTVSASVNVKGGGTIYGSTTFQIGAGGSGTPGVPGFDFFLEVHPPIHEVPPGGSAVYEILVMYNDPSYSGTPVQIHIPNLGPGMQFHVMPGGQLEISTSPNTPPGDYHLDIVGEAQGVVRQTTLTLIVREGEQPPPEQPPPEEPPPEQPPPEEPPPEQPPPEEPPPEEPPPEQPQEEYHPSQPEEHPPEEPGYQEGPEQGGVPMNVLYLIIGGLGIIIVLLMVMRRNPNRPTRAGRYCKNCGEPLEPGQAYCSSCGKRTGD
jgi:hypothetical protein